MGLVVRVLLYNDVFTYDLIIWQDNVNICWNELRLNKSKFVSENSHHGAQLSEPERYDTYYFSKMNCLRSYSLNTKHMADRIQLLSTAKRYHLPLCSEQLLSRSNLA